MLRRDVNAFGTRASRSTQLGRHGCYRLQPGYRLAPLMLNDEEAAAVCLALTSARELGLGASAPAIETALAKIHRVLPTALRARVKAPRKR